MELKANKLRIGNILLCAEIDIPYRVTAEDILEIDNGSSKSRRIPITETYLLLCSTPESKLNLSFILSRDTKIWVDKSNENDPEWYFVWKREYIKVEYLDEIQNLFFFLEKKELTLNL